MKALLRKDLPWIVGFLIVGTIALAAALSEHGFVFTFVVTPGRHQAAFHAAWIAGLVLGLFAANYDALLGTREFLLQRPIALRQLANARVLACVLVVTGCLLLAPIGTWLGFLVFDSEFEFSHFAGVPEIWASTFVMLPATAIGLFAGSLPVHWLLRLAVAGAWFVAEFVVIDDLGKNNDGTRQPMSFVAMHLMVALLLLVAARRAMTMRFDPDQPCTQSRLPAAIAVLGLVLTWAVFDTEYELTWVSMLQRSYPDLAVRDGEVLMYRDMLDGDGTVFVETNADHEAIGPQNPAKWSWLSARPPQFPEAISFDSPRWYQGALQRVNVDRLTDLYLGHDGAAWLVDSRRGALRRTGKGPDLRAFEPGSLVTDLHPADNSGVMVVDMATRQPWFFDPMRGHFVELPLPVGDDFRLFDHERGTWFVRGHRGSYVLQGHSWQAFSPAPETPRNSPTRVVGADPIRYEVFVDATPTTKAFHHVYEPRTANEQWCACVALACAAMRLPVLQGIAHVAGGEQPTHTWLVDPLLTAGRRPWLFGVCIVAAIVMAWLVNRRLRGLGADARTVRFWTVSIVLFGAIAALASRWFERPRAYAKRALPGPFPAPRIVTEPEMETVA